MLSRKLYTLKELSGRGGARAVMEWQAEATDVQSKWNSGCTHSLQTVFKHGLLSSLWRGDKGSIQLH